MNKEVLYNRLTGLKWPLWSAIFNMAAKMAANMASNYFEMCTNALVVINDATVIIKNVDLDGLYYRFKWLLDKLCYLY